MKYHFGQTFLNYSEEALQQVVDQAVGKPCNDGNGNKIGTIVKAERIGDSNVIEFEVEEL